MDPSTVRPTGGLVKLDFEERFKQALMFDLVKRPAIRGTGGRVR